MKIQNWTRKVQYSKSLLKENILYIKISDPDLGLEHKIRLKI